MPSCDTNLVICNLQDQNKILMQQNEEIKLSMAVQNSEVNEKLEELSQENLQLKQMLTEVLEKILELSSPCSV